MQLTPKFITDEVTVCDCCGKADLKATVAMLNVDTSGLFYFGRTCAARNSGKPSKQITKELRQQQQDAFGRACNMLLTLKRNGNKLTTELIKEVAQDTMNDSANTALLIRDFS